MPRVCAVPVDELLVELRKHEDKLRAWLERSEANAVLFVQNPAAALRAANLGMPENAILEFEKVLHAIETKLCEAEATTPSVFKRA